MLTPTPVRPDRSVAVITLLLDNKNTDILKKFHCSVCGWVVFGYYDTLHVLTPIDTTGDNMEDRNAITEVMCNGRWTAQNGHTDRCKTIYILDRNWKDSKNG